MYRASIALAGSGVPVGATHCPDLVYTALFGEFPSKSEGDFCSSLITTTEVTSRKAGGCCDASRSSEVHVQPCSGHQNLGFFGSSDPAQEGYGDTSRYWELNIRVSDLLGSGYRVQDPVEGEVKGNLGGQCLVYSNGATAKTTAIGNPMATAPTAPLVQIYWFTLQSAPTQLDLSSGSIRSPPHMDACLFLVCWMVRTPIPLMLVQLQAGLWLPFPRASADTGWTRQSHDLVQIGISWASIVEASSAENEETGRSNSSETAVAGRLFPAVANAKDNNGGQSKVVSVTGKAWSAVVAGLRKMGPTRVWVKKGSTTGLDMCSGTSGPATAGNQTGMVVGLSTDFIPTTSDLWSPAPQRPGPGPFDPKGHYAAPFLGLCDADFPPIRPLTNLGTRSEVKNSLISVPNHSHPVQLGSRTDKFLHSGNGTADANIRRKSRSTTGYNHIGRRYAGYDETANGFDTLADGQVLSAMGLPFLCWSIHSRNCHYLWFDQ